MEPSAGPSFGLADLVIAGLIVLQAIQGRKAGFVLGVVALIVLIAGVAAALVFEEPAAAMLDGIVPLSGEMRRLAAFALVVTIVNTIAGMTALKLVGAAMGRQSRSRRVTVLDQALGVLPAAARAVVYVGGMVFQARLVLPEDHEFRGHLERSVLAVPLERLFELFTPFARML